MSRRASQVLRRVSCLSHRGKFGGAGNPPVSPAQSGYPTSYLWDETWTRDSVLDLVRQFIHEVQEENEKGRKTGKRFLIFPRYQQLDCVRRLVADAREQGTGRRYLIQHSAGSGKTFTIAWLAHQLSTLHDAGDRRVFDSIVVITDRRMLDRQFQTAMRQFEQTLGVVENIDRTSRQLKEALESGKTIIVTTIQEFPVIAQEIGELPGKRFAPIADEAHSSQSGEGTNGIKAVMSSVSLEEGFILDVLANYTTYKTYWRLFKKVEDDPRYDKTKAAYLLKSFVDLHPHAISEKVRIMVEHFTGRAQNEIGGKAKAMIVTRSRLHAVRYKLAADERLAARPRII